MEDYYDILGVSRSASKEEIKAAYHALVHHLHSKKDDASEKKFSEIVEAYNVLSDESKRTSYNQRIETAPLVSSDGSIEPKNKKSRSPAMVFLFVVLALLAVSMIIMAFASGSSQPSTTIANTPTSSAQVASNITNQAAVNPTAPTTQNTSPASANLSPSVIAQIEPNVVEINCYSADDTWESSGSGISYLNEGNNDIETNYHVYNGAVIDGEAPTCYAVFPESPDFSYNAYYGDYQLNLSAWHYNPSTYEDAALFTLGAPLSTSVALNPIPVINNFYKSIGMSKYQCSSSTVINVGDALTIFGYPASGNALGISETVTEGIVSGILPGPIYKTNAAIDHGNSGGIAILNKNLCALGIPTLGESGLTAGIGYIQSYLLANEEVQ